MFLSSSLLFVALRFLEERRDRAGVVGRLRRRLFNIFMICLFSARKVFARFSNFSRSVSISSICNTYKIRQLGTDYFPFPFSLYPLPRIPVAESEISSTRDSNLIRRYFDFFPFKCLPRTSTHLNEPAQIRSKGRPGLAASCPLKPNLIWQLPPSLYPFSAPL